MDNKNKKNHSSGYVGHQSDINRFLPYTSYCADTKSCLKHVGMTSLQQYNLNRFYIIKIQAKSMGKVA